MYVCRGVWEREGVGRESDVMRGCESVYVRK